MAFNSSLGHHGVLAPRSALLSQGEPQVRGVHKSELGKLLCKKAQVEHLAGDPGAAATALAEAKSIAIELGAGPDSELGQALAEARAALSGSDA